MCVREFFMRGLRAGLRLRWICWSSLAAFACFPTMSTCIDCFQCFLACFNFVRAVGHEARFVMFASVGRRVVAEAFVHRFGHMRWGLASDIEEIHTVVCLCV